MLTSPGIGSGLDINSLVTQLVAAEGQPAALRLDRQEAAYTAEISAVGSLRSALTTFNTAVEGLSDVADFRVRKTTSTDKDVITATADDTATPGSYDVEVVSLASSQRIRSGDFLAPASIVGEGTLTITSGSETFNLTIDSTNSSLQGIRDAINDATTNTSVSATIVNVDDGSGGTVSRLILSANSTGTANAITVTAADTDGNDIDAAGLSQLVYDVGVTENMTELVGAADAHIRVFNQDITRSSNTISDAISGVTLDLKAINVGNTETVKIEFDKSAVTAKVNSFISAYNGLAETMSQLGAYNAATETGGPLLGDATLRTISGRIRSELGRGLTQVGLTNRTLADIGITTGENGKLQLDGTRLDAVMASDDNAVGNIFAGTGGYATRIGTLLDPYVGSDSVLGTRVDGLQSQIERITDSRVSLQLRLDAFEKRTRAQFFAMDQLVSQLSTTSEFLAQQLSNLPGTVRNNR